MKVIVSACLLGVPCRYKGGANTDKGVISFVAGMDVIPVCPEVAARHAHSASTRGNPTRPYRPERRDGYG